MEYVRHDTTINNVIDKLEMDGVAVIPNVLSKDEVTNAQNGMWDILEHMTSKFQTPIHRDKMETWKSFYEMTPLHAMLIQYFAIGHHQPVWDIRQNVNVADVFAHLWNCKREDLIASFDGISIHLPHEVTNRGYYRGNDWLHCDQSFTNNQLTTYQSFVTAYDTRDGDASLMFLKGSHKHHRDFAEKYGVTADTKEKKYKDDWYRLNDDEIKFFSEEKGCKRQCIMADAGSMVLWDSRLIHCGKEPNKDRNEPNFRFVTYVCMTPRNTATKAQLAKKVKAFEDLRLTTHNPFKNLLFGKAPRTYGKEVPEVSLPSKPTLTQLGRRLAGYDN